MALISYIDYTLTPSILITGLNWSTGLPVTNISPYDLGQPARSTSTDVTINIDLGSAKQLGVFAIPKHSLSYSATWRIRASNNILLVTEPTLVPENELIFDSNANSAKTTSTTSITVLSPPASIFVQENLAFIVGDNIEVTSGVNYLLATVTSYNSLTHEVGISVSATSTSAYTGSTWNVSKAATKQLIWASSAGFGSDTWGQFVWDGKEVPLSNVLNRPPALKLLASDISARYYIIEIEDENNTETYLDIHKLVLGPAWRTPTDVSIGYTISYEDKSKIVRTRGGQSYVNLQPQYRKFTIKFKGLTRKEVYNNLIEIDNLLGTGTPLLLCLAPEDVLNLGNKSVYGSQALFNFSKEPVKDLIEKPLVIEEWV